MPCEDYEDEAIAVAVARPAVLRRLVRSVRRAVYDTYENPRDVLSQLRSVRVFLDGGARTTPPIEKTAPPERDRRIG